MSDLISRQKVLNTLDFADNTLTDEERTVENYKALLTECIKVLPSAKNDGDLISRQVVDDVIAEIDKQYDRVKPYNIDVAQGLEMALEILDNIGKTESEAKPNE